MGKPIIFIVGPNAVGKSEVAARLAGKINAEIISCDSMQVYRGMDIITGSPSPGLRKKVPHHLIGRIPPAREYNVAQYRKEALKAMEKILKKGKTPLFVGGSGLYMSVLLDGIFEHPAEDRTLRRKLDREAGLRGSECLYKRLQKIDPRAAAKIHPHDRRRIVRALEVYALTGMPISYLQQQRKGLSGDYKIKIFCLAMPLEKLYARIACRIKRMFRKGLVLEVKKLARLNLSRTAGLAIGVREITGYLEGKYNLASAKELMQRNSRLYCRRQLTWFRKDKRIRWLELSEQDKPGDIAERIYRELSWKELY